MGLVGYGIAKLLDIFKEDGSANVQFLFGSAAPGGDTGEQDDAPVGSLYIRQNGASSTLYQKIGAANSTADWKENGSSAAVIGTWRPEKLALVTNDTLSAGSIDISALTDNDDGIDGDDVAVGEFVIGDYDGTPTLFEITAYTSATDVTIAAAGTALQDNDTFVCTYFLPDPAGQENKAIVNYNGTGMVKLSDVDWSIADAISLAAGYTAQNGTISAADSVNSAIEKLDGNQQDIQTVLGVAQGATNLGAFASPADVLMAATYTVKSALQRLGDLSAQLRGVEVTGLTTQAAVDSVPVASVRACGWYVEARRDSDDSEIEASIIYALNDGTAAKHNERSKLKFNNVARFDVDVSGGNMRLLAQATTTAVTVKARRIEVVKNVL